MITSLIVVIVSEVAKRSDKIGSLISSLPFITILTLIWLYLDNQSIEKINNHAYYTLWYVIPTLPLFIVFPILNGKMHFWLALCSSAFISIISFVIFALILRNFKIELL